jgi:hypothetical protein
MSMSLPNSTYIDSYIKDGQKATLALKYFYTTLLVAEQENRDNIFRIPINDFFIKHRAELESIVELYYIGEEGLYKPKTVSYVLYGTTELWLALLRLNNMKSVIEFKEAEIKIYAPNLLMNLINIFFKREKKI